MQSNDKFAIDISRDSLKSKQKQALVYFSGPEIYFTNFLATF